jgi:chaperone BCS1
MDVWVDFKHATPEQAAGIFRCFFRAKTPPPNTLLVGPDADPRRTDTLLPEEELAALAMRFGQAIPPDEFSVASLQGYLLKNKTRPRQCVDDVEAWLVTLTIGRLCG